MKIAPSPIYLDTSALAKLYVSETHSDDLEDALVGRRDVIVSDLAVTELTSAMARRHRDGDLTGTAMRQLYRRIVADRDAGEFLPADVTVEIHRAAEHLLLRPDVGPLRAADALHLAMATAHGARAIVTFDARMIAAARAVGGFDVASA